MKKLLILGILMSSTVILGATTDSTKMKTQEMQMGSMMSPEMMKKMNDTGMSCPMMNGDGMMTNMTPEQKEEMMKDMSTIQEKIAERNKLSSADNPNWEKIGELNEDIFKIKSKHMTQMMKSNHNMMKTAIPNEKNN